MPTEQAPVRHPVYRSINKPLLFAGVDRRLFFFAIIFAAAVFILFNNLPGGLIVFVGLYMFAKWATATDPQILAIIFTPVMNPKKSRSLYDPAKLEPSRIELERLQ